MDFRSEVDRLVAFRNNECRRLRSLYEEHYEYAYCGVDADTLAFHQLSFQIYSYLRNFDGCDNVDIYDFGVLWSFTTRTIATLKEGELEHIIDSFDKDKWIRSFEWCLQNPDRPDKLRDIIYVLDGFGSALFHLYKNMPLDLNPICLTNYLTCVHLLESHYKDMFPIKDYILSVALTADTSNISANESLVWQRIGTLILNDIVTTWLQG